MRPSNNFDGLRLLAAVSVVVGHAFVLTDAGPAPSVLGFTIHKLGVAVFFCISGYLIAGSWFRLTSVYRYAWHRLLRIVPALWVLVILTVFVVGPVVTVLSPQQYFQSPETFEYLLNLSTAATYRLPGVFEDHTNPAVNGSLWTIGIEVVCYVTLVVVALLSRKFAGLGFGVLAAVLAVLSLTVATKGGSLSGLSDAAPVAVYFFVGAVLRAVERSRSFSFGLVHSAAAVALWILFYVLFPTNALLLSWVLLPVCVIPVGKLSWPVLRSGGRFGDISYGVYLWGFLVQQIVIQLMPDLTLGFNVVVVMGATVLLAAASCHLVERPALRWKDWTPRWARVVSVG